MSFNGAVSLNGGEAKEWAKGLVWAMAAAAATALATKTTEMIVEEWKQRRVRRRTEKENGNA